MKLHTLDDFLLNHKSLRQAADVLAVPAQNLSWMTRKVQGKTYVLEGDDGTYTLLREVCKRGR